MTKKSLCIALAAMSLAACESDQTQNDSNKQEGIPALSVPVSYETTPSTSDSAAAAISWKPQGAKAAYIYGAVEDGIETYDMTGSRIAKVDTGEVEAISALGAFGKTKSDLLLALDTSVSSLFAYKILTDGTLAQTDTAAITSDLLLEGMCAVTSPLDGQTYVFMLASNGQIEQWHLYENKAGKLSSTLTRNLQVGSEPKFCVGDAKTNSLYVTEEAVGVWKFAVDVEADTVPELIDVKKFGSFTGEVGGLAVHYTEKNQGLLMASDVETSSLSLYDIADDHRIVGHLTLGANGTVDGVDNAGNLFATSGSDASLYLTDEDNGEDAMNFKVASVDTIAKAFDLNSTLTPLPADGPEASFALVYPTVETAPVADGGDAADDPAIWVHPEDASKSLIIGTNKQGGLYTYTLDGAVKQYLPVGKVNNVDVRYNVKVGANQITLVAASNRTTEGISLFSVDEKTGMLRDVADGLQPTGMPDPYGLCLYQSPKDGETYVFINEKDGLVRQWHLAEGSNEGKVKATPVREFIVDSTAEGCAADDDTGMLLVAEEDVALYKYSAEPDGGSEREVITNPQMNPALKDDLEGVSIYYGEGLSGYIVLSSQGNNSYAVFDREAPHAYRGSYRVIADSDAGIDGSSETDGLDVISTPLGPKFPYGVFIAQDGRNIAPSENQNFKLVAWENIADALDLEKYTGRDPRK